MTPDDPEVTVMHETPTPEEQAAGRERARILEHVRRLQKNATCKTVQKTCQWVIDRIEEGK